MPRWLYAPVDSDEFARTPIDLIVVDADLIAANVPVDQARIRYGADWVTDDGSHARYLQWKGLPLLRAAHETDGAEDDEYAWRPVPRHALDELRTALAEGSVGVAGDEVTTTREGRVWFTHRPHKSDEEYESPVLEPEDYLPPEAKCGT